MLRIRIGLALCLFSLFSSPLFSASIIKINKAKSLITIDTQGDKSYAKGAKVCIFDNNDKKLGCGVVKVTKGKKAGIRLKKKVAEKIESAKESVAAIKVTEPAPSSSGKTKAGFLAVRGFFSPALMTPGTFNQMAYLAPEDATAQTVDTLWSNTGTASSAFMGFGGEAEWLSLGIAGGFRYRLYTAGLSSGLATVKTNYDNTATNLYVVNSTSATAMGLWADYYLLAMGSLRLGAGMDLDMESVTFTATESDDNGEVADTTLYTVSSSLSVISLRFPLRYEYALGFAGLDLLAGATLMLPLASFGGPAVASVASDLTNGDKVTDNAADAATALGHRKGSIGFDLLFGLGMTF